MEERVYHNMYRVEKEHWWFTARLAIILRFMSKRLGATTGTRVLDVGCGTGAILEEFSHRYDATGIDPSPQAIAFCQQRGLTNVRTGTLSGFSGESRFDVITMFDVLEHIENDRETLRESAHRLVPGGAVLITVPAYRWLWSQHDVVLHHKTRYTRRSLSTVVTDAGLDIEHITYFNTLLFPLAAIRRVIQKITGSQTMDDLEIPSPVVNSVLRSVFELETEMVSSSSLPFGLSLLCLARKHQ